MSDLIRDWHHLLVRTELQRPAVTTTPRIHPTPRVHPTTEQPSVRESVPRRRLLSLGAGVQSTALLLLAAEGRIPRFDAAIFADTQWEPAEVYSHLRRLETEVAGPANIPIQRVSYGNIKLDSVSNDYTTVLPLFITNPSGGAGMLSRQCTQNYKLVPIYRAVRQMLGAKELVGVCAKCEGAGSRVPPSRQYTADASRGECSVCRGTGERVKVGPVLDPNAWVTMAIGFSTDEIQRVGPSRRKYVEHEYPLLDLGWSRNDAMEYLASRGWGETPRSACIGCPYHSNAEWQRLRDHSPHEWREAIAIDEAIRHVPGATGIQGKAYLHRDRVPLSIATIGIDQQVDLPGCSPFGCRSEAGIDARAEDLLLVEDERV